MVTDFAKSIHAFLTVHMVDEKGRSQNTVESYATAFLLLMDFIRESTELKIEKLKVGDLSKKLILDFLDWLERTRRCSASTRNVRLAAIKAFFSYLSKKDPRNIHRFQEILSISNKSYAVDIPTYLKLEQMKCLFKQPNLKTRRGLRDVALMILLYDSGARVQELIDLTPASLDVKKNVAVKMVGKGGKTRVVLLLQSSFEYVKTYMKENGLNDPTNLHKPLFFNNSGNKLTRAGVRHILGKYLTLARQEIKDIPVNASPHSMRHSKAMHLLAAGVSLVYIKHFLGHASIITTEHYARISMEQMEHALKKSPILSSQLSAYTPEAKEPEVMTFLRSFGPNPRNFRG